MRTLVHITLYLMLCSWTLAVVLPVLWVFTNALRSPVELREAPFGVPWIVSGVPRDIADEAKNSGELIPSPPQAAWANFRNAWVESHFERYFRNSVYVTGLSLLGILVLGAMASYILAKFPFRGSHALYLFFISGMMVPVPLLLVPIFFQFTWWSETLSPLLKPFGYAVQLHDSHTGLILIYVAVSLPFTILVLTGFFRSLPSALREAAIIDGCGEVRAFTQVMLPLAKPGLVSVAILNFIGLWNEYLFALVFVNSESHKTLPLGLAGVSIQAQYKTDFGLMFAGLTIVILPTLLVYMILQKRLTSGMTAGALKG